MTDQTISAALIQLADHGERIAVLADREASHHSALSERLDAISAVIDTLGAAVKDQAAILTPLAGLDAKVTALAAVVGRAGPDSDGGAGDGEGVAYQPAPVPRWWKLAGEEREQATARLRAWVEQVYRPGYGQLAAALGPCWDQHPICLYGLDILAELWSVLYLQPTRTAAVVSAQAEFQTRILPAITEQLITETSRCGHIQTRRPANGHSLSGHSWSTA